MAFTRGYFRKTWILCFGIITLILSISLGLTWPSFSLKMAYQQLTLHKGSETYKNWVKTPFPMYFEVYMFNISNANEWSKNPKTIKPFFHEIGPYVFQEVRERVGVDMGDETVKFNQTRSWFFKPELSGNLTLDDLITNINPISATLNYQLRFLPTLEKLIIHTLLDQMGSLIIKKSVRELLFDGYKDNQLDYLNKIRSLLPIVPAIPLTKFGWFVGRNQSSIHDGRFEMNNGVDSIFNLGLLKTWNGASHTKYYPRECGEITGTTGELWPPMKQQEQQSISLFIVDICRTFTLQSKFNITKYGMDGIKFVGNRQMLDGMDTENTTNCWCLSDKCPDLKPGLFNASTCQFGAPAFISFPHFYLADPSYLEHVDGLNPNINHEFYMSVDPKYGIPLEIRARLQLNLLLKNEVADISEDLVKRVSLLDTFQKLGLWVCYALGSIGIVLVGGWLLVAIRLNAVLVDDVTPILNDATASNEEDTCITEQ